MVKISMIFYVSCRFEPVYFRVEVQDATTELQDSVAILNNNVSGWPFSLQNLRRLFALLSVKILLLCSRPKLLNMDSIRICSGSATQQIN